MPSRPPDRSPTRRTVLVLLALAPALPAAGCAALGDVRVDPDWPGTPPPPTPDADELARRRAVASARAVRAAVPGGAAPSPTGTATSAGLVVAVADRHLAELGAAAGPTPTDVPPSSGAPGSGIPGEPPATGAAGLVDLLVAAAAEAAEDLTTTSAGLARLLAAVAASRSVLAASVADAAGLPAPAAPAPVSPAAPGTGTAAPSPTGTRTPSPGPAGSPLAPVAAGALAAARGVEVAAASLEDDARERALGLRDALAAEAGALAPALRAAGGTEPVPAPDYVLPGPVDGPQDAVALVVTVLDRLAATALAAVPALVGEERALPAGVLARTALAARTWRPDGADVGTAALPGTTSA